GDATDVLVFVFERKGGRPCDDREATHFREHVDDLFGEAVAEVLVLLVRAQIRERQHGNRWLLTARLLCRRCQRTQSGFERRAQVGRRLETLWGLLLQTPAYDVGDERRRNDLWRLRACDGGERVHSRRAGKRAPAGQHFVEHCTEGEDVGARVEGLALCLFRRHVRGRAGH